MRSIVVWGLGAVGIATAGFLALHGVEHAWHSSPEAAIEAARQEAPGAAPSPGQAGMRVAIEPETGELTVPSPQQQKLMEQELQEALSRSDVGLYEEVLPDGTVKVNLQGRFQNASIAVIDDDGNLHTSCAESHDGAQAAPHHGLCNQHATPEGK